MMEKLEPTAAPTRAFGGPWATGSATTCSGCRMAGGPGCVTRLPMQCQEEGAPRAPGLVSAPSFTHDPPW